MNKDRRFKVKASACLRVKEDHLEVGLINYKKLNETTKI